MSIEPVNETDKYSYNFLNRSIPFLTEQGIKKLKSSTIAIAGLGGVGGAAVMTLARMGVGNFILADPRKFDEPDINRQWAAFRSTLGKNKAMAYEKILKDINPEINIIKLDKGVPFDSLSIFLDNVDIVIDALDYFVNYESRKELYRQARKKGVFVLTSGILGFGALLMGFSPFGMTHEYFMELWNRHRTFFVKGHFVPEFVDIFEAGINRRIVPSLSLSVVLAGSLLVTESLIILLKDILAMKREPITAPKFVIVDLFRQKYSVLDVTKL